MNYYNYPGNGISALIWYFKNTLFILKKDLFNVSLKQALIIQEHIGFFLTCLFQNNFLFQFCKYRSVEIKFYFRTKPMKSYE